MGCFNMQDFLKFALGVTLLMLGNAASGAMKALKKGEFSGKELVDGLLNYLLWLATILCLVAATEIYGGDFEITIGDSTYTITQAVDIAKRTVYVIWAGKLIQNVYEYSGISKQANLDKLIENANKTPVIYDEIIDDGGIA